MLAPDVLSSYDGGSAMLFVCRKVLAIAAPVSLLYITAIKNDIGPVKEDVTRSMPSSQQTQAPVALNLRLQVLSAES
jgi:hypothetical protein